MSNDLRTSVDGRVLTITIARPQRMNAFGMDVARELAALITGADADPGIRVIVITGEGKAFCTGADLAGEGTDPQEALDSVNSYVRTIVSASIPVIAKVNGPCAGMAVGLALAADLTFVADTAYFLLPFVGIGLLPDAGTTALVPGVLGRTRALGMALLGNRMYGPEAFAAGMVTSVHAADELDDVVAAAATKLASGPREAIAATKRAFNASTLAGLDDALARETKDQVVLLGSDDYREGVAAMLGKRAPQFGA